jgi:hypothetical protein
VHHGLADALAEQRAALHGALDDGCRQHVGRFGAFAGEQGRQLAVGIWRAASRSASICIVFAGCLRSQSSTTLSPPGRGWPAARGEVRMRAVLGDGGGDALMSASMALS